MNKRVESEIHVQSLLFFFNRFLGQSFSNVPNVCMHLAKTHLCPNSRQRGQTIRRKHHTRNKKYLDIHYVLFVVDPEIRVKTSVYLSPDLRTNNSIHLIIRFFIKNPTITLKKQKNLFFLRPTCLT